MKRWKIHIKQVLTIWLSQLFGLYQPLTDEPLAWAVKKGNSELLNELNQALEVLNKRGLTARVINTWIPMTVKVGQ